MRAGTSLSLRVGLLATLPLVLSLAGCGAGRAALAEERFGPFPSGLTVTLKERHYEVRGSDWESLCRSAESESPVHRGSPAYGLTRWGIDWSLELRTAGALCRVERAEVDLELTTTLPRWEGSAGAPDRLARRWEAFREAVAGHEREHQRLAVETARTIADTLEGMNGVGCAALRASADREARRLVSRFRRRNVEYDRETEGGRTEGVVCALDEETVDEEETSGRAAARSPRWIGAEPGFSAPKRAAPASGLGS